MAKLGVTPTHKTVDDLKSTILTPSLTPYFEVQFPVPDFLSDLRAGANNPYKYLTLLCTEAVLPGNSLATFTTDNDYTGVTEKMPHRKVYDQELQLTFYVNAGKSAYYPIRFFESYISYIAGEDPSNGESMERLKNQNYFYRLSYPDDYMIDGLIVKKFEQGETVSPSDAAIRRLGGSADGNPVDHELSYEFIRSYPTAINSMQLTYGQANVLKCSVTYSYIRYIQHNTFPTSRKGVFSPSPIASVPDTDPTSPNTTLSKSEIRTAIHGKPGSREDPSTPEGQIKIMMEKNQTNAEKVMDPKFMPNIK